MGRMYNGLCFFLSRNLNGLYANGPKLIHLFPAISSSTSAFMWQPCHHHFPRHCHVNNHIIGHVNVHVIISIHIVAISAAISLTMPANMSTLSSASSTTLSSMSSICNVAIESETFIFIINNRLGLGCAGLRLFYDGFKMLWINLICDDFVKNVTRCNLWCSIHNEIVTDTIIL